MVSRASAATQVRHGFSIPLGLARPVLQRCHQGGLRAVHHEAPRLEEGFFLARRKWEAILKPSCLYRKAKNRSKDRPAGKQELRPVGDLRHKDIGIHVGANADRVHKGGNSGGYVHGGCYAHQVQSSQRTQRAHLE